jgi:hypothetical protein
MVAAICPPSAVPPKAVLLQQPTSTSASALAVMTLHPLLSHGYFGKIPNALASKLSCAQAYAPNIALNVPVVEVVIGASAF